MHRKKLLDLLRHHEPFDESETRSRERIDRFVRTHPDCFERPLSIGHITGSAWVISRDRRRVLLTHHRKLNMWVQLGGHADGDSDALEVALREAREESGIDAIEPISFDLFDVDVHEIPEFKGVATHDHHDLRFLLRVHGNETFRVSDESHELKWFDVDDDDKVEVDTSVQRMWKKWRAMLRRV